MKDVLMLVHFHLFPWETGNGRFHYIANMLCKNGVSVEILTSSFLHSAKAQRNCTVEQLQTLSYKVTFAKEPDYPKNVCLKRLSSHKKFAKGVKKYLQTRKKPDMIYCAVPSLDAAFVAAEYCKKNNIKFIIDIQDLWPEAFQMVFHVPVLSSLIFSPMKRKADKIYAQADEIIGVSQTYCDRALKVNKKTNNAYPVFLGTDLAFFDGNCARNAVEKTKEKFVIGYCGTLGSSYDLNCVIEAMRLLKEREISDVQFRVFGDGPLRAQFTECAKNNGVDAVFYGSLAYPTMCAELAVCDATINPICKGAAQSIINKHGDYAAVGLPVINTQESEEYRNLIDRYACGINCACGSSRDVAEAILRLRTLPDLCRQMGQESRRMAEELFDRKVMYQKIADLICGNFMER